MAAKRRMQRGGPSGALFRRMLREPGRSISILLNTPRILQQSTSLYGTTFRETIQRARELYGRRFTPQQALTLGLFDPAVSSEDLDRFASNHVVHELQHQINAKAQPSLIENKGEFYLRCVQEGLPVPALYGIYRGGGKGQTADGRSLSSREDWCQILSSIPVKEILIKPVWGSYGHSVFLINRTPDGFIDQDGRRYTANTLLDRLESDPKYNEFVIQERLHNHADIRRISNAPGLQTCRIITLVARHGRAEIIHASLKLIVGSQAVDNFDGGSTGNITVNINLSTGGLKRGMIFSPERGVAVNISKHPTTGFHFEGIKTPGWQEIRALALRAAKAFLPARAVGWDIALTPNRATLVEGNLWFDAPPAAQGDSIAAVVAALRHAQEE